MSPNKAGPRILLIDDNAIAVFLLRGVLPSRLHVNVDWAMTVEDAIRRLLATPYDIVILKLTDFLEVPRGKEWK